MASEAWNRLYSDFLLPSRLPEYRALLERALALGYVATTVGGYVAPGPAGRPARTLVLRHDVDTDPATAGAQFEIERELGTPASYFFRLSTVDPPLMRLMAAGGAEVGYHFEEIATVAKELRLHTKEEVRAHLPLIRDRFRRNLAWLREETGLPITALAAHGDMANRHLGLRNHKLLSDKLRRQLGIELEVYEAAAVTGITSRFVDHSYPEGWRPADPREALERGDPVVYLLTHPRHWRRNVRQNLKDDLLRLRDGVRYHGWRGRA